MPIWWWCSECGKHWTDKPRSTCPHCGIEGTAVRSIGETPHDVVDPREELPSED